MKNKILTGVFGFALAILIITFSIGLPIYFRPFYYMQIGALEIEEYSGFDRETIVEAFDDVMDYLTIPGNEFGTGKLEYSVEGKLHFVDCKGLFDLNAVALIISLATVVTLIILAKKGIFTMCKPFGFNIMFSSGVFTLGFFALVGGIVAIDFSAAFTVFHKIFFPGKSNWLFDWWEDEIIRILPQQFFMNCAILIFSSIVILCVGAIVASIIIKKRENSVK
ncbi:MAG: TIGR01906 family membrane protein [Ruminococcaceae bacterium]|nr:TIGR01906 family membrane protein [Oscillospiraceae bacterium]